MGEDDERRCKIDDAKPGDGEDQHRSGVAELAEGTAHDHPPDAAKALVGPHAHDLLRETKPDRARALAPVPLDPARKRAIVDDGVANGLESAGAFERCATHEDATSSRCRGACAWVVDPGERVEHGEEEHEGRDEESFPEPLGG